MCVTTTFYQQEQKITTGFFNFSPDYFLLHFLSSGLLAFGFS